MKRNGYTAAIAIAAVILAGCSSTPPGNDQNVQTDSTVTTVPNTSAVVETWAVTEATDLDPANAEAIVDGPDGTSQKAPSPMGAPQFEQACSSTSPQ